MGNIKKSFILPLVMALSLGTLAACSGGNDNADQTTDDTSKAAVENGIKNGKFDPPITMSTVLLPKKYTKGDSQENNVHDRWMKDRLGIINKDSWYPANTDQYKQKLQLAINTGEELPDIVPVWSDPILVNQLIDSGQFIAIDDLWEQYAGETMKAYPQAHPEVWYPYTRDEKKYAIPVFDKVDNNNPVLWFREDWMKKLNLEAPKTIADLEHIMDQFKNHNPDGLSPKDVYPLTVSLKKDTNTWMAMLDWLFGAYGTIEEQWNLDTNGKIEYGSINPGAKQALAKLNEWMDKGYIHPDSALWDEVKASESWTKGNAGIMPGLNWVPDWPADDLLKNVKGAQIKAYPIPAGPDGKIGTRWDNSGVNGVLMINKNFKHPEAIFLYYNYLLDNYANPPAGGEFEYGFAKGYDWDIIDGAPTVDKTKIKDYNNEFHFITGLNNNPAVIPELYMQTMVKLSNGGKPETPYEKQVAEFRKPETLNAAKIVMSQKDIRKQNYFTAAPTPTMVTKWNLLRQSELETFNKIIYGKLPVDAFDTFVKSWKLNGGDQITKEINDWYTSVSTK